MKAFVLLTIESESHRFNKLIPMGHIADFLARIDYEYGDIEEHINQLFDKNKRLEEASERIRKFDYSLDTEEYRLWKIDHNKELIIELNYEDVKTGNLTITVEPHNEVRINNSENLFFFIIMFILILFNHRENVKRLINKEESKTKIY